ncbi:hypothetical protein E2C01_034755 [Portunus trituberculatus]|uniref:Uncharacterized protein n=1 Tax=Portunus trituberculatus TaxID=210409 RepID=A0A5B7F7G3_PORTR|nr:hypothetical protein [Portunus trituberculatus]
MKRVREGKGKGRKDEEEESDDMTRDEKSKRRKRKRKKRPYLRPSVCAALILHPRQGTQGNKLSYVSSRDFLLSPPWLLREGKAVISLPFPRPLCSLTVTWELCFSECRRLVGLSYSQLAYTGREGTVKGSSGSRRRPALLNGASWGGCLVPTCRFTRVLRY